MKEFQPFSDLVLVRRLEESSSIPSGSGLLSIPDSGKEKPQEGMVIATGRGYVAENGTLIPCEAKVGDHVFFGKHSGEERVIAGDTYLTIRDSQIIGRLVEYQVNNQAQGQHLDVRA